MFLEYADYKALGGNLPEEEFTRQEYAARMEIDRRTFGNLKNVSPIPEEVKMLTLELIQRGLCGNLDGEDYISQSAGRVSNTKEPLQDRADTLIRRYLDRLTVNGASVFYGGNI